MENEILSEDSSDLERGKYLLSTEKNWDRSLKREEERECYYIILLYVDAKKAYQVFVTWTRTRIFLRGSERFYSGKVMWKQ